MSDIANLAAALAKVQAELPKLERDRTVEVQQKSGGTYSYSYVTLAALNDAVLPLLAKNGLSFAVLPGTGSDGKINVGYRLLHESGEQLSGEVPVSGEGGIQMIGGRITYLRRYCLAAVVGVAADEDDESHLAEPGANRGTAKRSTPKKTTEPPAAGKQAQRAPRQHEPPPLPNDGDGITPAQLRKLHASLTDYGITDRDVGLAYYADVIGREVTSSKELSKEEARKVIDRLESELQQPFDRPDEPATETT